MLPIRGPGLFCPNIETALRERAEWMERLGPGALLTSDDLSDSSSEFDIGGLSDESEPARPSQKGEGDQVNFMGLTTSLLKNHIDSDSLDFKSAQRHFARAGQRGSAHFCSRGVLKTSEPLARSLQRLRAEVNAFCTWSTAHEKQQEHSGTEAETAVVREADTLGRDARDVARLMQQVARSAEDATASAPPQQVWLPTQKRAEAAALQRIVEASRTSAAESEFAAESHGVPCGGFSYQLSAAAGPKGSGWIRAAESEAIHGLEDRIQCIREALGHAGGGGSLAGAAARLHRRLDTLRRVGDERSCEQLRASVQLLSSDIDMAISESQRLEVLEAEEQEIERHGGHANGGDEPAQVIAALHERVAGFDALASHIADVDRQLAAQEHALDELGRFAEDLAGAEARTSHVKGVLQAVTAAAERMCASAADNRERLSGNIWALEAKLAARGALRGAPGA